VVDVTQARELLLDRLRLRDVDGDAARLAADVFRDGVVSLQVAAVMTTSQPLSE
jgi:hypothetical protein